MNNTNSPNIQHDCYIDINRRPRRASAAPASPSAARVPVALRGRAARARDEARSSARRQPCASLDRLFGLLVLLAVLVILVIIIIIIILVLLPELPNIAPTALPLPAPQGALGRSLPAAACAAALGRGDDTVGNPHRAQISQFEFFEFIFLLLKLDKQLPPCRAIRADSISVNSTFPSFYE